MSKLVKQELVDKMQQATPVQALDLLHGLTAEQTFDLLIEHPHPEKVVELMPLETLYLTMNEIGPDDGLILLELASPEQVQGFVDIDCWERDRMSIVKTRTWLYLINEMDDDSFIRNVRALDLALLVLFFRKHLRVHKIENLDDAIPYNATAVVTPDGRHVLEYVCSEEHAKMINTIMLRIAKNNFDFFMYLIEAIHWEINSENEEDAYQERLRRMEARGFPDYFTSLEIFTTVDPDTFIPPDKIGEAPLATDPSVKLSGSTYLALFDHADSLLRKALAENFAGRDEATVEVMKLTNMATVADRVSFLDIANVRQIVARTDGYLNIGLQHLIGDDLKKARELLTRHRLVDIHKIGRSLIVRLTRRAKKLVPRATIDGKTVEHLMLDGCERELVYGLLQKHMVRFSDNREEVWNDLAQVRLAEKRLDAIESYVDLMHDILGFTPDIVTHLPLIRANFEDASELTYRTLFNTFFCHDWLDRKPAPMPLTREDLDELACRLQKGAIPQERLDNMKDWLTVQRPADADMLWPLLERHLQGLAKELAGVDLPPQLRREVIVKV